jgi:hypothetical protein
MNYPCRAPPPADQRLLDAVNEQQALLAEFRHRLADFHRQTDRFTEATMVARAFVEDCKAQNRSRENREENGLGVIIF